MSSATDFLKTLSHFDTLSTEAIGRIGREAVELSFGKGEILFLEGEPCPGLYVVKSGRIRIFKSSPEGREQVLLIAGPKDSINEVPAFDGGTNPASAAALAPATVYLIPKETLLSLVAECPVAMAFIKLLSRRLRHLAMMIENLSFHSVGRRVAKMLLDLAVAEGGSAPVPRLTQDEMAAIVGSVRDVIGRELRRLEKTGAIRIEGHRILVVEPQKLREMILVSDKSRIPEAEQ